MEAVEKPGWKRETAEGVAFESPFDKYAFLAQICYQIMVWDLPLERRLFRTYELLSYLTEAEKKQFQINPKDEQLLANAVSAARENKRYMKRLDTSEKVGFWDGTYHIDTQLLKVCEVEYKKTHKPRIKKEALAKRIADLTQNHTVFGLKIEPKHIDYKVSEKLLSSDDKPRFNKEFKGCVYADSASWEYAFYIKFFTGYAWIHEKLRLKHYSETMEQQRLIGRILQPMLDAFEGKKILMIPEERKIP